MLHAAEFEAAVENRNFDRPPGRIAGLGLLRMARSRVVRQTPFMSERRTLLWIVVFFAVLTLAGLVFWFVTTTGHQVQ